MRRDTLAFTVAGVVFGFVSGYMAARWDVMPGPVAAAPAASPDAQGQDATAALDPDEVKAMESLAAREPGERAPRVELGNLYMDHRRWEQAIRWYREALALGPDANVQTDLGACLVHAGRPEEGLAEFDQVLKKDPQHRNALFNRGVALLNLGRPLEAADAWETLLRRHPDDPQLAHLRERIEELRATARGANAEKAP